ncbi:MAG: hypothetical protein KatS3mg094_378 [Candidatus Parcubacteria bacterium]|nr:MAG: hypothetical protein KatS3mg094_378 [Candidatus Parcubacteria bacterium]
MLKKLTTLISENLFTFLALSLTTLFLYLTYLNYNFLIIFLCFLIFFNFYFLRGSDFIFFTLISPLVFYFLYILFKFNPLIITFIWIVYYSFLLRNNFNASLILTFLIILLIYGLLNYFNFFFIFLVFIIFSFLIFFFVFKQNFNQGLINTLIISEFFWLIYFLPYNYYFGLISLFLLFLFLAKFNFK